MGKAWTEEEINFVQLKIAEGLNHTQIGKTIGRSTSSIATKLSKLGLTKTYKTWDHLSKDDILHLIREIKSGSVFDTDPELPCRKVCERILGVKTWSECISLANAEKYIGFYRFYVVEFEDTDGTIFRKFGITKTNLIDRYYFKSFKVILEVFMDESEARKLENYYKYQVTQYSPKDIQFYSGHEGHTECFING